MPLTIRCPNVDCKGHIVQKNGKVRLKGQLLLKSDGLHGHCYWCGTAVKVPMELKKAALDRFVIQPPTGQSGTSS